MSTLRTTENAPWWAAHKRKEAPHQRLIPLFEHIESVSAILQQNTRRLLAMYEYGASSEGVSYAGETNRETLRHVPVDNYIMSFPHAANTIDTFHAKLCKPRIDPMCITEGANYYARKRAKQLQKAILGEFHESNVEAIKEKCILDMLVTDHGCGFAFVSSPFGKIQIEHVPCEDVYFDEAECRYGNPRTMFRRWKIDRYQALELFASPPEDEDEPDDRLYGSLKDREKFILNAPRADLVNTQAIGDDQIILIEAWHLRSGPNAKDGRHVVALQGCTLLDEEYKRDRFQFAQMVGLRRPRSVYGRSVMRLLAPAQREHDITTTKLQNAHAMTGTHLAIPRGANIDVREIDNEIATVFEYDGAQPPVVFNPDAVNPQFYSYRANIPQEMKQAIGLSDMSTSGQVPAGLSQASGRALRVFQNAEDQRLILSHRAIERWVVEISWLIVEEARYLTEHNPDYTSRYVGKNSAERLPWKELLGDKDDFVIRVAPASALSNDPAGRIDDAQQLLAMGIPNFGPEEAARVLDIGLDVQAETDLSLAPLESLHRKFASIIEKGRYIGPTPHDALKKGIGLASDYVNKLMTDDNADEMSQAIEMLNQWIVDAQELEASMNPPPAPPMPPQEMGPPPGPEMMPPANDAMPPMAMGGM